jgi:hypothetical protein
LAAVLSGQSCRAEQIFLLFLASAIVVALLADAIRNSHGVLWSSCLGRFFFVSRFWRFLVERRGLQDTVQSRTHTLIMKPIGIA